MTNWQEKRDIEINAEVTAIVKNCGAWEFNGRNFYHCGIDGSGYFAQDIIRYCESPSDAWKIIVENKISIMNDGDTWEASVDFDGDLEKHGTGETLSMYYDKNPLRAAMIVFLMIHEDKK